MVRTQTLPFDSHALATPGQLAWIWLNTLIDYDERVRRIHKHCLPKFQNEYCEVCQEPIVDVTQLDPEIQDKVYRPGAEEVYNVDLLEKDIFNAGEVRVVDEEEIPIEDVTEGD